MPRHSWKPCGLAGSQPGAGADLQSEGGGRHTGHLALQITASRETASREHTVDQMQGCAPLSLHQSPTVPGAPQQARKVKPGSSQAIATNIGKAHYDTERVSKCVISYSFTTSSRRGYSPLFLFSKRGNGSSVKIRKDGRMGLPTATQCALRCCLTKCGPWICTSANLAACRKSGISNGDLVNQNLNCNEIPR